MKVGIKVVCGWFLFLFVAMATCSAQDTSSIKKKHIVAVLVQLRSEHNRITALTKAHLYLEVAEVEKDAVAVRTHMILDFHNNFRYCPVYYYIDTNADLIKKKLFDDVLLKEDGSPVKDPVINSQSTNYLIAYYGYPVSQSNTNKTENDNTDNTGESNTPFGKGLVLLNDEYVQYHYFYKLGYDDFFFIGNKKYGKYIYKSKHFDIEYFPFAHMLNELLYGTIAQRRRVE